MAGTSQEMDFTILSNCPPKYFLPVRKLINNYDLEDLISLMKDGASESLKKEFPTLIDENWNWLLKRVCLTRLTAIHVTPYYPAKTIIFLLKTAMDALECNGYSKSLAFAKIKPEQTYLALWVGKFFKLLVQKKQAGAA
jgi:hypothetical protein